MKLTFQYDPAADVLDITSGRNVAAATPLAAAALGDIAVETGSDDSRDTVGLIMLWASGYVAPHFQLNQPGAPFKAGDPEHIRYDRETDTLTWGTTVDDPEMISQAGDLTAYWQLDPCLSEEDEPFYEPIGLSLRNASKHLAPHFVRVEPPAG